MANRCHLRMWVMFAILDMKNEEHNKELEQLQIRVKQLEQEQGTLELELRNLFLAQESANDGAWVWHVPSNKTYLSPVYKRLLGYEPHELPNDGSVWFDRMLPEEKPHNIVYLQDFFEGRVSSYELDHRLVMKNGEIRWFRSRGDVTERDSEGNPIQMAGILTDITERRHIEQQMRLFYTITEGAPDPIGAVDLDDTIIYLNPAYREMVGGGEELIGQHISVIFPGESIEEREANRREVLEKGAWKGELELRTVQGERIYCQASRFVVRDEQDNPVFIAAILRNLTEQQRQDQERQALQDQLIEAQQNAIRELSSPLIPLSNNLLLMPLIGSIDSNRAQIIMETLLEGVAQHQANKAIVDITGVSVVDTQVANAIIQAAQAVKLLGAQTILTGIGPTMAQTLIHLGADLSSIVTYGNLQQGIAAAMQ